jgi:hypothetical protein
VFRGDLTPFDLGTYASSRQLLVYQIDQFHDTGAPSLESEPITAENLFGSEAGDDLEFQVTVRGRPGLFADVVAYKTTLRVHVGEESLPEGRGRFVGWYSGDTHYHTMYTNNWAEYGLPHLSTLEAAKAIGLSWTTTTDHSCDLDEPCLLTGDRIDRWRYCTNATEVADCEWFDRTSTSNGWEMANADAELANNRYGVGFFHTGEEVNLESNAGSTIHALAFRASYIESPGSGFDYLGLTDCQPLDLTLSNMLGAPSFPTEGLVFAAHPKQPLAQEINGGTWGASDIDDGASSPSFVGLQLWNTRITKVASSSSLPHSEGGLNPLMDMERCSEEESNCYPHYLDKNEIPLWDRTLSRYLTKSNHQVFMLGGSDAHGDFNYMVQAKGLGYSGGPVNDNAYGKVRTVVPLDTPSAEDAVEAMGRGVAIATDGPLLIFGFDRTGDGTIDQTGVGEDGVLGTSWMTLRETVPELTFRWQSTPEFGEIEEVYLYRGTAATEGAPARYDVLGDTENLGDCDGADRLSAECTFRLDASSSMALPDVGERVYYRAMALAASGMRRCLTNPIWFATRDCIDADGDSYGDGTECDLFAGIQGVDCDDSRADAYPGASEACNGHDDDCDGEVDEGLTDIYYEDVDGDRFGDGGSTREACEPQPGYVTNDEDCDDRNENVYPGAPEVCNGEDDDCDGEVDEGLAVIYYRDVDGDGFGDKGSTREACEQPRGYVTNDEDCDDGDNDVYPGAPEACNSDDDDCDGEIDQDDVCGAVVADGGVNVDGGGGTDGDEDADGGVDVDGDGGADSDRGSDGDEGNAGGGCSCNAPGTLVGHWARRLLLLLAI